MTADLFRRIDSSVRHFSGEKISCASVFTTLSILGEKNMDMFCKRCGYPLDNNCIFCPKCGYQISSAQNTGSYRGQAVYQDRMTDSYNQYAQQSYPSPGMMPAPKKNKKKGLIIGGIIGGSLAGIAIVAAVIVCLFVFVLPQSKETEYTLFSYSTADSDDYISVLCSREEAIPFLLTVKGNSGDIMDTDGNAYASLDIKSGRLQYADGHTLNVSLTDSESGYIISSDSLNMEFRTADTDTLNALSGEYNLSDERFGDYQEYGAYMEHCRKEALLFPTHLKLNGSDNMTAAGKMTVYDGTESGEVTLEYEGLRGTVTYPNGSSYPVIFCSDSDTLRIYTIGEGCAFYFNKAGTADFSSAAKNYEVFSITNNEIDDLIAYWSQNNYLVPTELEFNSDGTGRILNEDGSVFAEFSVNPSTMMGTINYSSRSASYDIFITIHQESVTIYDWKTANTYVCK